MRLFPATEAVWSNFRYDESSRSEWARQRRVCSLEHFDTYFRFVIGDDVLSRAELDELLRQAGNKEVMSAALRAALDVQRAGGGTKAALILDEFNLHADAIEQKDTSPLLETLFELGDALDVVADQARPFSIRNNKLRIHWLLRRLTLKRFDLPTRSAMLRTATKSAALGWLVDFACSARANYHPPAGRSPSPEAECLMTAADTELLRRETLARLRKASRSGELAGHADLATILYGWRQLSNDHGKKVKRWCDDQLTKNEMIIRFAKTFISHYERPNWSTCGGTKWTSKRPPCTSVESSRVPPARIPSWEMNCEPSGGSNASRSPGRRSCSPQSEAHLSRLLGLPE
jgi:predicted KAP-like P-loop ATPase